MKITWHGHACFSVTSGGYTIVLDPFTGVDGYPDPSLQAQQCLCSHGHFDHSYRQAVSLRPGGDNPFTVQTVASFHDDAGGNKRGENTIHILSAEGLRIVHLGDLGHQLSPQQLSEIGPVDLVLLPIGGTYTLDPVQALQAARSLKARVVIPMHYRTGSFGFDVLRDVEEFLSLWSDSPVCRLDGPEFTLTADTPAQLAVVAPVF